MRGGNVIPNTNYGNLKDSYLFYNIAQKTAAYLENNPGKQLLRMGIGDVSQPLCPAVIEELKNAVEDQAHIETFHGYMPECGAPFLRETIAGYYSKRGIELDTDEVFVSSGASDELGDILDLFGRGKTVLIPEPAYPAYVDANIMAGNTIVHLPSGRENGFLPEPPENRSIDIIYICSPNNPTGAVFNREKLKKWVEYANNIQAIILFDAAYEAFIEEEDIPHSIYEIPGTKTCAIEICSLSKTAGFTGTRCGYTIVPKTIVRGEMNLNSMWVRNRTTKTNGISYILQRGAAAVFTDEGQKQIHNTLSIYKQNAKTIMKALDKAGIWYTGGKNAPYVWLECPNGMDSWQFFDLLLNEIQVVGTPGEGFGTCGKNFFRFSTFGKPADTNEAAKRLLKLLG
ncbi:MAG: LL-diaminopimelate aminotransferase [Clostridiales bacterium]|nr:LL-diaminopimelate aminotransferase [Clostridiales bacterium]